MKRILFLIIIGISQLSNAQIVVDTLAFQDFEASPAGPVWNFTGPVVYDSGYSAAIAAPPNSPLGIDSSRAWVTTAVSGGLVIDFDNVVIPAGYDSIRVRFNLAAMNLLSSTGGPDDLDYVLTDISTDSGATYYSRLRIRGAIANNSFWPYAATGMAKVYYQPQLETMFQPANSGLQTTEGYSTCEIVFPGSVTHIKIRITARSSSSSDTWLIDNLVMEGQRTCSIPITFISPVACGSYTSPAGDIYTTSALFNDTISLLDGCDSIISVDLTVHQPSTASLVETACKSYLSPAGFTYTSSGIYTDTIANTVGCDSIITIDLTIDSIDTDVSLNGGILMANASGMDYQWLDCDNAYAPLAGATLQSYVVMVNGSYAVAISDGICTDTSVCTQIVNVGIESGNSPQSVALSPNPFTDHLDITLYSDEDQILNINILDMYGRIVLNTSFIATGKLENHYTLSRLGVLTSGVYFLNIRGEDGAVHTLRAIKE